MEWDAFLPHVLPSARSCPDGLAIDHVIKAARMFCERTLAWSYACEPIFSAAQVGDYALQLGDGEELVRVLAATVAGREVDVLRGSAGRAAMRQRRSRGFIYMATGQLSFTVNPVPGADDIEIVTDIAVKPALAAQEWPDDLAQYIDDIAHGAIATLCLLPKCDWTDNNLAAAQGGLFEGRIDAVKRDVERGYGRSKRPAVSSWM
jgi:hypothetical protein